MSFVVGFVQPIKFEDRDPTALDTVLEALQSSSKGQLPYPEPLLGIDPADDVCDSKYIGDLCHITASMDFRNEVSFCDSYDYTNAVIFCDDGEDWNSEYNRLDSCTSIKEYVEEPHAELDAVEGDCKDQLDALASGPDWTSYRTSGRSPIKMYSPERGPGRTLSLDDEAPHDGGEVTGCANEDNCDSHHNVASLLSRLQIDKSLPAVLARVKQYQAAYVGRVAAIHARTMAELERCRLQQQEEEADRQQQEQQHEQQLQAVINGHTDKLIASRAEEAEQRKADLLAELAEQQEQEAARQHQEEQELLLKQQEQEALQQQQQNVAERARQEQQSAGADLLSGLKDSYENFSSALDQVLREIRERGDVELPSDTTTELNDTLKQSSQLLAEADTEQDHELLQQAASRLERGITVLHCIRGAIETHKAATGEAAQAHSSEAAATRSGNGSGSLHSLAREHPDAATSLAQARDTFNKLAEVHQSVSAISQSVASQQSELRSQLSRALSIVNQFNNDSATSNRQKLHQLVNLVSGGSCDAGGVQVSLGSDKQGPGAMFVREQLASRLIALAHDKQVNSQAVYASLMLRLWQVDPLVQHLCLYHLYKTCPYLVPYLPLREEYGSEEEYHRALGYRHKDGGEREALDSYIKRMGAAGQLYGRMVSLQLEQSPLGLHHAWQLLSRLLVSPAQSAVTCSVLHGLLSTAGAMMAKVYGHQFQKMMALMGGRFLPLLEEATREGGEADLASLKALLGTYFSSRSLPAPSEGYRPLL